MLKLLPAQLPWWLGGPGIGLCVVALYGLANQRLAVSGAWLAAVVAPIERRHDERWRVEFLIALIGGALAAGLLGSATRPTSYPALLVLTGFIGGLLLRGLTQREGARPAAGLAADYPPGEAALAAPALAALPLAGPAQAAPAEEASHATAS